MPHREEIALRISLASWKLITGCHHDTCQQGRPHLVCGGRILRTIGHGGFCILIEGQPIAILIGSDHKVLLRITFQGIHGCIAIVTIHRPIDTIGIRLRPKETVQGCFCLRVTISSPLRIACYITHRLRRAIGTIQPPSCQDQLMVGLSLHRKCDRTIGIDRSLAGNSHLHFGNSPLHINRLSGLFRCGIVTRIFHGRQKIDLRRENSLGNRAIRYGCISHKEAICLLSDPIKHRRGIGLLQIGQPLHRLIPYEQFPFRCECHHLIPIENHQSI